ncbi:MULTISPECIES: ATP-dependent nuclease [Pseudomonas]|uniref:AAA family ATPase n=1 Tax=Pseudomonas aphyarum TaxID=2942629 RepID=A0ABT5PHL5_9PSED|nr:AAA family ATPase [Pseudomonas aphyarum]MDD0967736.1 AAA family ATPase [Pseudomonas aphyarum]MDD1123047.1 AAA family ATPase [Pseudomonas aphyarum]
MLIKSLRLTNFKKFSSYEFLFNDDVNVFVGDNNAGKSTILEALEIVLNSNHRGRPFNNEFTPDLFNSKSVELFLATDMTPEKMPELVIEAFIEGIPEYKGTNNSLGVDAQGIMVRAYFDPDYDAVYRDYLASKARITSIPIEFYKVEWLDFAGGVIKPMNKQFRALYIDPTRIHPTVGKNQYILNVLNTALEKDQLNKLTLNYRENLQSFNSSDEVKAINADLDADNKITEKMLSIAANTMPAGAIQTGLQLEVDEVPFHLIGKGEQSNVQIKLAIHNKSKDIDLVMMEEPENHLSHMSLIKLVTYIEEQRADKQLFITTHSSYVLNKLSIDKICLLHNGYQRLDKLAPDVVKTLRRLPGYDTLRVALSQKVVLVEGPSDELILKKIYLNSHGRLPEQDGIDIIVVRGVGFKTFIEIGKEIGTAIHVLRDNDGDYKKNIVPAQKEYAAHINIKLFSSEEDGEFSLEPAMIAANATTEAELNAFAKIALSKQTLNKYDLEVSLADKRAFLVNWFKSEPGNGKGTKKVDTAMRLFDTDEAFKYPDFLKEVLNFA